MTGGDPAVAPMVRTQSDSGRTCTGGVMAVLSTLTRRCTGDHVQIVKDYAVRLIGIIDSSVNSPARPTSSRHPGAVRSPPTPNPAPL